MKNKLLSTICLDLINNCKKEFKDIDIIIKEHGKTSNEIPYLTRYALIKAHGTIEQCYKNIISDVCESNSNTQIKKYFHQNFVKKAVNLRFDALIKNLNDFDDNWPNLLKKEMKKFTVKRAEIQASLASLVETRNELAHGQNPQVSYRDIKKYFYDAEKVIIKINKITNSI